MAAPIADLSLMPLELVFEILLKADLKSVLSYCQTYSEAAKICATPTFWRRKHKQDYGEPTPLLEGETWRERYKTEYLGLQIINPPISIGGISGGLSYTHHYGIIDDQGKLYMAGDNRFGQLGVAHLSSNDPLHVASLTSKVISVHCVRNTTSAVTEDGKVYIWGYLPQLGDAGARGLNTPQDINFQGRARKVYSHRRTLAVINEDFSAYFIEWTSSWYPGLGRRTDEKIEMSVRKLPIKAIDIAFDDELGFYLISKGGDLYKWISKRGQGGKIQLQKINLPEPVKQISLGWENLGLLSVSGKVYQLSDLSWKKNLTLFPSIPGRVSSISFRYGVKSAVTETGKLYMWGNTSNQRITKLCYVEPDFIIPKPVEIEVGLPVTSVAPGSIFTLAVTSDGVVNYWGNSKYQPG